jgi:GT2 family glycosyltransferase
LESLDPGESGIEAIVVDNGEDEQLLAAAEKMAGVEVIRPGRNLGFAGGCNLGANRASGESLVFMNQDTITEPIAIVRLASLLEDPTVGIATARLRLLEHPDLLNSSGTVMHLSGLAWAGDYREPVETVRELREAPFPSGAAMALRADVFAELGRFTEELFMYCEDLELGWRARMRGLRVVVSPAADVLHEYEFDRNPQKQYLLERNRLILVISGYPGRLLLVLAPLLVCAEVGLLMLAVKEGWAGAKLRGWGWCLRHPRWLVGHRRQTQRLRRVPVRDAASFLTPVIDTKVLELPRVVTLANRLMSRYWFFARLAL